MAAASAAVKLGSFVKEEAICSTKKCRTSGESILGFALLVSVILALDLGFVKSRVMLGPDEPRVVEQGTEPSAVFMQRFEPDVASSCEG